MGVNLDTQFLIQSLGLPTSCYHLGSNEINSHHSKSAVSFFFSYCGPNY